MKTSTNTSTTEVRNGSRDQLRWNDYGLERIRNMERDPARYRVTDVPLRYLGEACGALTQLLEPIEGKRILEVGCGRGEFAVWLAKQGAQVTAVDIGPDLIAAAKLLAKLNHADCDFRQGSATQLPVDSAAYDAVVGVAILHHLSEADVVTAVRESHRVLKSHGACAVFHEAVENSRVFDFIQNLFPTGEKGPGYRPSVLQRRAWREYVETLDDRDMTTRELVTAGEGRFRVVRVSEYGLLVRLARLTGRRWYAALQAVDRLLFNIIPPLKFYCQSAIVEYWK